MIMVPSWVTRDMFDAASTLVASGGAPAGIHKVRLETLAEGTCVQTLHLGSYDEEAGILDRMHHEFIPEHGLHMTGRHHEIYLSDFRKVAPEKLRTIFRQPVSAG